MLQQVFIFCIFALILSGCHVSSKVALNGGGGRNAYNISVQQTSKEEMLLNLVRLRYTDIPYFLDVSSVTTQFTYQAKGAALFPIPGFTRLNPAELGGELSWQNQPTLQYTPLDGQAFAIQMLRPIDLRALQQLIFTGWDIDRVFKVIIQSLDNIPNATQASSPTPSYVPKYKKFQDVIDLLRVFQTDGQLQIGVGIKQNGQEYNLAGDAIPNTMQISFPSGRPESDKLAELFSEVRKNKGRYILNMNLGYDEAAEIGIMTRSLIGCMYFLSLGVNVPKKDIENGCVFSTKHPDGTMFDWRDILDGILDIKYSKDRPSCAFSSVKYRDHWYYITDCDVESKRTFVLLMQLYNLQSGETKATGPLLSIPLG